MSRDCRSRKLTIAVLVLLTAGSACFGATNNISFVFAVNGFRTGAKFDKVTDVAVYT
jgi:hypothetical protein